MLAGRHGRVPRHAHCWYRRRGRTYDTMDADLKAFYEYHRMHMEPWDGPAGIVLTDGRYAACLMDRNGLRPARYVVTSDRHITLATRRSASTSTNHPADVERKRAA